MPFQKGHEKLGGRKKGVGNHPVTIKVAWKRFCDEQGDEMQAWASTVMFQMPDIAIVGDGKAINLVKEKLKILELALKYGWGIPNKVVNDGGHSNLSIVLKQPLGVDPVALRMKREQEEARRGLGPAAAGGVRQGVARQVGPRPMSALMKASGAMPKVIRDEDGTELEPIADNDPHVPDRPDMDIPSR